MSRLQRRVVQFVVCVLAGLLAACQAETPPDSGEAEPGTVQSAVIGDIFTDDFNSATLGSNWSISTAFLVWAEPLAAQQGAYGVRINGTAWLELRVNTTGYTSITLEYARRTVGFDTGESLTVEWLDGSTWRVLESTRATAWGVQNVALGAAAANRADLRIRFRTNGSLVWETADVDTVRVRGDRPAETATTLVHAQLDTAGRVLMSYVRGATHFTTGYPQFAPQLLGLPRYTFGSANLRLAAPSAVLDTTNDQIVVASAHVSPTSGTTIHMIRAGYADMLPEATPSVILTRPGAIQSPVQLTRWGTGIAALWAEDGALVYVRSSNGGATWTAPAAMTNFFITGQFAVTSSGNELYVIYDSPDGANPNNWIFVSRVNSSGVGSAIGTVANLSNVNPIRGLSIAVNNGDLFSAYATSKTIAVVKWPGFAPGSAQSSTVTTIPSTSTSEHHSVTIQPSPYGWAIQYVQSNVVSGARQYSTYGYRSSDGLNYSGTQWLWQTGASSFTGGTSMSLTPVATAWIHQLHDSGANKNSVYNFIIAGEGFTYGERNTFLAEAQTLANNLLSRSPFYFNKNLFNIFAVASYSKESYYDDNDWGSRNTIFDASRDGDTNIVSSDRDPMDHAIRMIHDRTALSNPPLPTRNYGVTIYNSPPGKFVGILPWDTSGVPVAPDRTHSSVVIHEFMHTGSGGFGVGDHELYNQGQNVNKSFDGRMSATASPPHAWQDWFTFTSPATSRLIPVTAAFRADPNQPPYSSDPASPSFVSALDYLNSGLWESWRASGGSPPQYAMHHACMMNTNAPRSETFCPICAERVVSVLTTQAGGTFSRSTFRAATGAYLEFPLQTMNECGNENATAINLNLTGLIRVRSGSGAWTTVPASAIETYDVGGQNDTSTADMGRVNLTPWITSGQVITVAFQPRTSSDPARFLYLPSIQVVNSKGARYSTQPADTTIRNALTQKVYNVNCNHMHWDLAANGELRLSFTAR